MTVIGGGYVGLASGCFYAQAGHDVTVVEADPRRRAQITRGELPFYEPGLGSILRKVVSSGRFSLSGEVWTNVQRSEITFLAVGTPSRRDGSIDLAQVRKATRQIGDGLRRHGGYHYVIVRSTVVPGTTVRVVKPILEKHSGGRVGRSFGLAMQPEFLREGKALKDMNNPDKIVIGALDGRTRDYLVRFYKRLHRGQAVPILTMNASTAETVKYANNSFLACKISFINEIANICQGIPGVDVVQVADAIGLDRRIGRAFLDAGLGFGGSCLPKDVRALILQSQRLGYSATMLRAALAVNDKQPLVAVEMIKSSLGTLKGRRIAVLGCSFKPGTDDMREARSLVLIAALVRSGAHVTVYDPKATKTAKEILRSKVEYAGSVKQCLAGADCAITVTEWDEFKRLTPRSFDGMRRRLIVDGRRIYAPSNFARRIEFKAVGLGPRAYPKFS